MRASTRKLAGQLLKNWIRFQFLKFIGRPGRPQAVSLEITHECIAKCIMCNSWKIPREIPNLPMEDWGGTLTTEDYREIGRMVRAAALRCGGGSFGLLEGGYNHQVLDQNVMALIEGLSGG